MNGKELKEAMMRGIPVKYRDVEYKRISAIIYRPRGEGVAVSAELEVGYGSCLVIAPAEKVEVL